MNGLSDSIEILEQLTTQMNEGKPLLIKTRPSTIRTQKILLQIKLTFIQRKNKILLFPSNTVKEGGGYLTALRWPRSSGGSLRSLTASITPERRSVIFLSGMLPGEVVEELEVDEEEAHRGLDTPRPTVPINGDDAAALAARVAMARRERERRSDR